MPESLALFFDENRTLIAWIGILSASLFLLGVLALPALALWLPADGVQRHLRDRRLDPPLPPEHWHRRYPYLLWTVKIIRNTLGCLLLVLGLAMLVLPGPGLLTVALSLILLDLPGKQRFERKLLSSPQILRPLNALRQRYGRPPLLPPDPVIHSIRPRRPRVSRRKMRLSVAPRSGL